MIIYNAKKTKPQKTGYYITFAVYYDVGGFRTDACAMQYNKEQDGWNIGIKDMDMELYPEWWAELPDGIALLNMIEEGEACLDF